MTASPDEQIPAEVQAVLAAHGLSPETALYRQTLRVHLTPADEDGAFTLTANPDPSESVVDVYGEGHLSLAAHVGAGLAFAASADQWTADDRVAVAVRLGDVLAQGGRVYPVESVITEQVWYCTLPAGSVRVRIAG
jgi:hypothetical protein